MPQSQKERAYQARQSPKILNLIVPILDVRIIPLDYIAGHLPKGVNIADNVFRGPNGFLPVQYWDSEKIGQLFAKSGVSNNTLGSTISTDSVLSAEQSYL